MRVLIAAAGRLGSQIAQVLAAAGNDVTIVEQDDARLAALAHVPRARPVAGDACDASFLEHADALSCDLVIAATGRDEDDLVISPIAKRAPAPR
ncbi:NAD-binding protein [Streptomyces sp. NPDC051987]|uniref:NAD-binding protein n=1 Tax=Streptomyces sp. NPDC051987 TaxID=3155808 RepID=UPI00343616C2